MVEGAHQALHEMVARGGSFSGREWNCAFLNTRDGEFATAASAVGFDFPDDARAVVTLDYDGDGDVDVITTNRTAPRLRILLNRSERLQGEDRPRSVTLLLDNSGTGNQSAIGASVKLVLKDAPPIIRTVSAGAGFLSASSTRLTVGVGQAQRVEQVTVTWPGGETEDFGPIPADRGAYALARGASAARPQALASISIPTSGLSTKTAVEGPGCDGTTVSAYLALAEPLPPIERAGEPFAWQDLDLEPHGLQGSNGAPKVPTVLTLWSIDCRQCQRELEGWKSEGVDYPVLALSVDQVIAKADGEAFDFRRLESFIDDWPQPSPTAVTFGNATYELLSALQTAVDRPFARDEDLALPATFVFDANGMISSIHRGPVAAPVIEAELAFLNSPDASDPDKRRERCVPFDGKWIVPAPKSSMVGLARSWIDAGHAKAAAELLTQAVERGEIAPTSPSARPTSRATAEAARILYDQGDLEGAILAATVTSTLRPEWAKGHFNRATMLDAAGRTTEADEAYTKVIGIRAKHWQALANRGLLRSRSDRKAQGVADLEAAIKALPKSATAEQRQQLRAMLESVRG